MATKKKATSKVSDQHREAMALGRERAAAVEKYLRFINRPKRRGPSRQQLQERLDQTVETLQDVEGLRQTAVLELTQQKLDLEDRIADLASDPEVDGDQVEAMFVKHAAGYGEAKGISYTAWRERGVPAGVLRRAGIARTRRVT